MTESHSNVAAARTVGLMGPAPVLFLCEHAARDFPASMPPLGMRPELLDSHIAWDPGALALAERLAAGFVCPLVAGGVSRLLYDCNRPPEAPDAIPLRSETFDVPFNHGLNDAQRTQRVAEIYYPFCETVEAAMERARPQALVTIHSFTRVYHGAPRDVEIGVLHDDDSRLADALLARLEGERFVTRRNEPYGPEDGVTHSLRRFALPRRLPNVMLEIRNDLLRDAPALDSMAELLTQSLGAALGDLGISTEADP